MPSLYFDHAATTPLDPQVAEAMMAVAADPKVANPSSLHQSGRQARRILEDAREELAALIDCHPLELVFTSGGTEANNQALLSVHRSQPLDQAFCVSNIEHHAVLHVAEALCQDGRLMTLLPVDSDGVLSVEALQACQQSPMALLSVMAVNNEIGTVQDLPALSEFAHRNEAVFHSDAVQALGKMPLSFKDSGADLMSFSAHKVYGPRGVGALCVKRALKIHPLIKGGGQEDGRRAGTENVAGIVGFVKAVSLAVERLEEDLNSFRAMQKQLEERLLKECPEARLNAAQAERVPHISNLCFGNIPGESLLMALDAQGIAVSPGSACTTQQVEPSHVLLALGLSKAEAEGSLRFSMGRSNTSEDVDALVGALVDAVKRVLKAQRRSRV